MLPSQVCTHIAMANTRGTTNDQLKEMLADVDFSIAADFGTYPIHEIAKVGRDLVDFAVDRGADLTVRSGGGYCALDIAIAHDSRDVVAALLRHGVPVGELDADGRPPLLAAVDLWPEGEDIVRMLLEAGADPDQPAKHGRTARDLASDFNHPAFSSAQ